MTTMILGNRPERHDTPYGGESSRVPRPGYRLLDAIRRSLISVVSIGPGRRVRSPLISSAVDREIEAIDSFAHFLSTHPDMPTEHRARFLNQILRSCKEIRKGAS